MNIRNIISFSFLLMVLGVSSCAGSDADSSKEVKKDEKSIKTAKPQTPICPQVAILRELQEIMDYGGEAPDPAQLVSKARLQSIDGDCAYTKDGIDVRFNVNFAAMRGPRLGGLHASIPYFVAVVDPDQNILNKELMTEEFKFSSHDSVTLDSQNLHVFIPLPKDKIILGPDYQIVVGFQLRKEQVSTIRENGYDARDPIDRKK